MNIHLVAQSLKAVDQVSPKVGWYVVDPFSELMPEVLGCMALMGLHTNL
jgi:hypothetical protein